MIIMKDKFYSLFGENIRKRGEAIIISFVHFSSRFYGDKEMNEMDTMKATMTNYEKLTLYTE